jgi:hypothetical protein
MQESIMRVASYIICDVIEKKNSFADEAEKKAVLVFLPGM